MGNVGRFVAVFSVAAVCTFGWNVASVYAGCSHELEIKSQSVTSTPSVECLEVTLGGDNCIGKLQVMFENHCDEDIALNQTRPEPRCDGARPSEFCEPVVIPKGESEQFWDNGEIGKDGPFQIVYEGVYQDEPFTITVDAVGKVEEISSCSTAPLNRPVSGTFFSVFAAIGLAAGMVVSRRRRIN